MLLLRLRGDLQGVRKAPAPLLHPGFPIDVARRAESETRGTTLCKPFLSVWYCYGLRSIFIPSRVCLRNPSLYM